METRTPSVWQTVQRPSLWPNCSFKLSFLLFYSPLEWVKSLLLKVHNNKKKQIGMWMFPVWFTHAFTSCERTGGYQSANTHHTLFLTSPPALRGRESFFLFSVHPVLWFLSVSFSGIKLHADSLQKVEVCQEGIWLQSWVISAGKNPAGNVLVWSGTRTDGISRESINILWKTD